MLWFLLLSNLVASDGGYSLSFLSSCSSWFPLLAVRTSFPATGTWSSAFSSSLNEDVWRFALSYSLCGSSFPCPIGSFALLGVLPCSWSTDWEGPSWLPFDIGAIPSSPPVLDGLSSPLGLSSLSALDEYHGSPIHTFVGICDLPI